jgi:hypothetical protein
MSEYYEEKRASWVDGSAYLAFPLGFLGSALYGWRFLRDGFDTGHVVSGLAKFLVLAFATGIVCAGAAMLAARIYAQRWERRHRATRDWTKVVVDQSSEAAQAARATQEREAWERARRTLDS